MYRTGYQEQVDRVRRYYERFRIINDGFSPTLPSEMYVDDIMAFFMNCYHIKDWLINDPQYTKYSKQQIEHYVTNTPELSLCADICNGLKHMRFNRVPRSGAVPQPGRRVFDVGITEVFSGEAPPSTLAIQQVLVHNGREIDAFTLAGQALAAWDAFI